MEPTALLDLVTDLLPVGAAVSTPHAPLAAELSERGFRTPAASVAADATLLLAGEVAAAEIRAAAVLDEAVRRTRPGGWVIVAVPSATYLHLTSQGQDPTPAMTAGTLHHMMTERGLQVRRLVAPGATAHLARRAWRGVEDLSGDSTPGLVDGGPVVLAAAVAPAGEAERSATFWTSVERRIVSASGLISHPDGRLLVIFDSFKQAWTLPGGLIDAGETPADAAVREVMEEGGVTAEIGDLLGVFSGANPDRLNLVYGGVALAPPERPVAPHDHEVSEVRWVDVAGAAGLLRADHARKVRLCLDSPGGTWAD